MNENTTTQESLPAHRLALARDLLDDRTQVMTRVALYARYSSDHDD